jgi:hypothetical protein
VEELKEIPEDMLWINETEGIVVSEGIKNSGGISSFIFALNLFLDTIDGNAKVIRDAYDSDKTAYEQTKAEIAAKLAAAVEMLRNAGAGDSVDAIIDRLEKIKMAMDMLDAAEPYIDAAVEYEKQFEEVLSQTLGQLGLTTDDLMKMTQDAMESLDSSDI